MAQKQVLFREFSLKRKIKTHWNHISSKVFSQFQNPLWILKIFRRSAGSTFLRPPTPHQILDKDRVFQKNLLSEKGDSLVWPSLRDLPLERMFKFEFLKRATDKKGWTAGLDLVSFSKFFCEWLVISGRAFEADFFSKRNQVKNSFN